MPLEIPNAVAIDPASPNYWPHHKHLGVRVNGVERKSDVSEFNVAEGWAKVHARNGQGYYILGNGGRIVVVTLRGKIEPYWRSEPPGAYS